MLFFSLDLYGCPEECLSERSIECFKSEVVLAIDEQPYTGSSVNFKIYEDKFYIDLLSPKVFDPDLIIKMAQKYFLFTSFNKLFIERGKGASGNYKVVNPIYLDLCSEMGRVA